MTGSKVNINFCSLCIRPCWHNTDYKLSSISFNFKCKLWVMRGGTLLILGHKVKGQGQILPPCEGMPRFALSSCLGICVSQAHLVLRIVWWVNLYHAVVIFEFCCTFLKCCYFSMIVCWPFYETQYDTNMLPHKAYVTPFMGQTFSRVSPFIGHILFPMGIWTVLLTQLLGTEFAFF